MDDLQEAPQPLAEAEQEEPIPSSVSTADAAVESQGQEARGTLVEIQGGAEQGVAEQPEEIAAAEASSTLPRKGLDRARQVEADRVYDAAVREADVKGHEWQEERREAGKRVFFGPEPLPPSPRVTSAAQPESVAQPLTEAADVSGPAASASASAAAPSAAAAGSSNPASTLRRVKQLDASQEEAIERECGVKIRPSSDVFRLVLKNAKSAFGSETSLLLITINDAFLCEAPPREAAEESQASASTGPVDPTERSAAPLHKETDEAKKTPRAGKAGLDEDGAGGVVEVELAFFRSRVMPSVGGKSTGAVAKKLDKVPVLHVTVSTSDGLSQAFEFLGVHQRQYFARSSCHDAFARNLDESLLKVVLEFIFHPSRSRYAREHLVLRECGASAEALELREELLPDMADEVLLSNNKIRTVDLDFSMHRVLDVQKGRSILVVDERMLEVALRKPGGSLAKAPNSKFSTFNRGFLTGSSKKKKQRPATARGSSSEVQESTADSSATATAPEIKGDVQNAELQQQQLESGGEPSAQQEGEAPPCASTTQEEKRRLLLPAADVSKDLSPEVRAFADRVEKGLGLGFGCAAAAASGSGAPPPQDDKIDDEDDLDEGPQDGVPSLSELARQLFGDGEDSSFEVGNDERTESTGTPSLEAGCEHSEPGTEDGVEGTELLATNAGGVGLRLLQQRRRRLADAEDTSQTQHSTSEAADELIARWMKQRW